MQRVLSAATVTAVGLTCKAYLYSGLCSISVHGLPYLMSALENPERESGQGILTGERYHTFTAFLSLPSREEP
jgi:monolysocardiolipin acyltransferase